MTTPDELRDLADRLCYADERDMPPALIVEVAHALTVAAALLDEAATITAFDQRVDSVEVPSPDQFRRFESGDRYLHMEFVYRGHFFVVEAKNPYVASEPVTPGEPV